MQVTSFLLAEAAFVSENQRMYVHGAGFVSHDVPSLPTVLPQLAVSIRLRASLDELDTNNVLDLDFLGPNGDSISGGPAQLPLPPAPTVELPLGDIATLQVAITVSPFPIVEAGRYTATLSLDGQLLADEPFVVRVQPVE